MSTIRIEIRNVYGEPKAYPICSRAQFFAKLAGTTTLTRQALRLIQEQGYDLEVVQPGLNILLKS